MSFNIEIMAEIALTKFIKLVLSFGYWGAGVFFIDGIVDNQISENLPIPNAIQNIAASMFIAMTVARLIWFVYDKFFLENRERRLKMKNDIEDLNQKIKQNLEE